MSLLTELFGFVLTLAALVALSRWIGRQVQIVVLRLTGDQQVAQMAYYLLLLPGILLHELSHALMARLLGLKVGKLDLGPKRRGRSSIELGSVTISKADAVRESLVGLAPFLAGTAILVLVGYRVFDVGEIGQAWSRSGWSSLYGSAGRVVRAPDFWLWAYVIFVVSNAMTPSASDRRPWLLAGLYLAVVLVPVFALVRLRSVPEDVSAGAAAGLQTLTLAFLFTLALDLLVAAALWLVEVVIIAIQQHTRG